MLYKVGKFIKKNAFTIVLAILPPLAIWFFFQNESSDISVSVISSVPVISLESEFSRDVEVLYKSKPVDSLYVADIRITNEGNKSIEKTDFDHPLQIAFNGEVISPVDIVSTTPKNLPVKITVSKDTLTISPLLLMRVTHSSLDQKLQVQKITNYLFQHVLELKEFKKLILDPLVSRITYGTLSVLAFLLLFWLQSVLWPLKPCLGISR